jgi:L-alanine-DL-glutamate epimerase-like enolase superfamily enzyme
VKVTSASVRPYVRELAVAGGATIQGAWVSLQLGSDPEPSWGEASSGAGTTSVAPALELATMRLDGREVRDARSVRDLLEELALSSPVRFGLEVALLAGLARRAGVPLRSFAAAEPGRVLDRVAVNALVADVAGAKRSVAAGFSALKVKIGEEPASDAARVRAIREAVGPAVELRLDANLRYSASQAEELLDAASDLDIAYLEDPTADYEAWAKLVRLGTPLALDRDVSDAALRERIDASVWIVKPMFAGGFFATEKLAEEARRNEKSIVLTSVFESPVGVMATAQLAARLGVTRACGLNAWGDPVGPGVLELPAAAGLGAHP